jgi:hypothetical protein
MVPEVGMTWMGGFMGLSLAVQALGRSRTCRMILVNPAAGSTPRQRLEDREALDRSRGVTADQAKGGSAMTTDDILAIGVIFAFVAITGIGFLVSVARHRKDRRPRPSRGARDRVTRVGRFFTILYVLRPGDDTPSYHELEDDPLEYSGSYRDPWA